MPKIGASEVRVGDKITVRFTNKKNGSFSEAIFTVDKIEREYGGSYKFYDSESDSLSTKRGELEAEIFLLERKPDLAREMLDLYNATEGDRMVRMRALVDQLDLVKSATNANNIGSGSNIR